MTGELTFVNPALSAISLDYEIVLVHRRGGDDDNWVDELDKIVIDKFFGNRIEFGGTFVRYKVDGSKSEELMRELKERGNMALWEVD